MSGLAGPVRASVESPAGSSLHGPAEQRQVQEGAALQRRHRSADRRQRHPQQRGAAASSARAGAAAPLTPATLGGRQRGLTRRAAVDGGSGGLGVHVRALRRCLVPRHALKDRAGVRLPRLLRRLCHTRGGRAWRRGLRRLCPPLQAPAGTHPPPPRAPSAHGRAHNHSRSNSHKLHDRSAGRDGRLALALLHVHLSSSAPPAS
mmetsp:Transcript_105229/g.339414  ORF Transcript_105229/g.339414 Transcript_105229/m.339414 type:complete len:204 (+) Transcript_105229:555-1166(+)